MHRPLGPDTSKSQAPGDRVTLSCLGSPAVLLHECDKEPRILIAPGKPLAVLGYLLLAPSRTATRDRLVDLLWGSHDLPDGRKQLRNALHHLRSSIGRWVIEADEHDCTLSASLDSDVARFNEAIQAGKLDRALTFYRSDFFAGFGSKGSQEFELWAETERAHFRSVAARAAEACCRAALNRGRFADARLAAKRLQEIDPHSELGWSLSLETAVSSGDPAGKLAEAERFEAWLRSEGRDPDPTSRALLRLARQAATEPEPESASSRSLAADMVGREAEFTAVLDAWAKARAGATQLVEVIGPSGLGKTRLLEDVGNRFRASRHRFVSVRAHVGERGVPFAFLVTLVGELARLPGAGGVLPTVVPILLGIDPRLGDRFSGKPEIGPAVDIIARRSGALQELLAAVSDDAPVALFLDDIHWIDAESRDVLTSAVAHLSDERVLIVVASRSASLTLSGAAAITSLPLRPLLERDVWAMMASMAAFPAEEWPSDVVGRITSASAGIPLLVLAAIEQLVAREVLSINDGTWQCHRTNDQAALAGSINPIDARLRALSPDAFAIVVACAVSGVPLPRAVLRELARANGAPTDTDLFELERFGYLSELPRGMDVAHDSLGEAALRLAEPGLLARVQEDLGHALTQTNDDGWIERGIRHLVAAKQFDEAFRLLPPLVAKKRAAAGGSLRSSIAATLGTAREDELVARALRVFPVRVRLAPRHIAIAASLLLALSAIAAREFVSVNKSAGDDELLEIVMRDGPSRGQHATIAFDPSRWAQARSIAATLTATGDSVPHLLSAGVLRPGTNEWAVEWPSAGGGGPDVALAGPKGFTRRLVGTPFDETPAAWSPDGRWLAIETSQFGDSGHKEIGILDVSTGALRPFDAAHESPSDAWWSPDGTRIAFEYAMRDGTLTICVRDVAGRHRYCEPPRPGGILGWMDDRRILIASGRGAEIEEFDAVTKTHRSTGVSLPGVSPKLSPGGDWLVYSALAARWPTEIWAASTSDLSHPKRVVINDHVTGAFDFQWRAPRPLGEYLDSLSIDARPDTISVGTPFLLRASGYSRSRRLVPVRALEWTSLNPDVATIDSSGIVNPIRPGAFTVEASAGGWRTARRMFHGVAGSTELLFDEDWSRPLEDRWRRFGHPFPRIVSDDVLGHAFLNNGDGDYFSGAYLPQPFDARDGLALDAIVRTHITREQWQYLQIGVQEAQDLAGLERDWNHVSGYLPSRFFTKGGCVIAYPSGEGPGAAQKMDGAGELPRHQGDSLPPIAIGVPTRIRVQLFPDGRCGLAVDGEPFYISPQASSTIKSMVVVLQGNSVGTRMLVGHLTVRRGVPADIDWNRVGERRGGQTPAGARR